MVTGPEVPVDVPLGSGSPSSIPKCQLHAALAKLGAPATGTQKPRPPRRPSQPAVTKVKYWGWDRGPPCK